MLVRALRQYSEDVAAVSDPQPAPPLPWFRAILTPQLRAAAMAVVVLAAAVGAWRLFVYRSPVDRGIAALNEAFAAQRPMETRVTELGYARYSGTRGDEPGRPG